MSISLATFVMALVPFFLGALVLRAKNAQKAQKVRHLTACRPGFFHTPIGLAIVGVPKEIVLYSFWPGLLAMVALAFPPYQGIVEDCVLAEYFSWYSLLAIGYLCRVSCFFGEFQEKGDPLLNTQEAIAWLAPFLAFGFAILSAYPILTDWIPSARALDFFYGVQVPGEAMADAWARWIIHGSSVAGM